MQQFAFKEIKDFESLFREIIFRSQNAVELQEAKRAIEQHKHANIIYEILNYIISFPK